MDKFLIGKAIPNAASYEIQIYDASGSVAIGNPVSYTPEAGADISCNLTEECYDAEDLFVGTEYKIKCKAKPEEKEDVLYVESAWSAGQPFKLYEKINIKKIEVEITGLDEGISTVVLINETDYSPADEDYSVPSPLTISFYEDVEGNLVPLNFQESTTFSAFDKLGEATIKNNMLIFEEMSYANAYSLSQDEISIEIPYSNFNITESE